MSKGVRVQFKLPATDMRHYRMLVNWRNAYRESLKDSPIGFTFHMENKLINWDRIKLYDEICARIDRYKRQAT